MTGGPSSKIGPRFLVAHAAFGFVMAVLIIALVLALDIGGARTLFFGSSDGWIALAALTLFVATTMSCLQLAFALATLKRRHDRSD